MSDQLVIRVDASSRIGTGHVMRSVALGQAWLDADRHQAEVRGQESGVRSGDQRSEIRGQGREAPSVVFICAEISEGLADRLETEGFDLVRINAEPGTPEDIRQTVEALSGFRSHPSSLPLWLVLDGYHFGVEYQRAIRAASYKLLLIDDCNHLPEYECELLLNQNINAAELKYSINPEARLLLGTQYSLLRREFLNVDAVSSPHPGGGERGEDTASTDDSADATRTRVLVTMGGADPDNVTLRVVKALEKAALPGLTARIVVGPANPHQAVLETALQHSTSNIQLINSADMAELMNWADLAISAAGSTCWELLSMGVPFATVILADNQEGVAHYLKEQGGIHCFGWAEAPFESDVIEFLKKIHEGSPQAAQPSCIIDGLGAGRVVEQLRKCSRDP